MNFSDILSNMSKTTEELIRLTDKGNVLTTNVSKNQLFHIHPSSYMLTFALALQFNEWLPKLPILRNKWSVQSAWSSLRNPKFCPAFIPTANHVCRNM